jgi:hypothetical protein
MLLSHSRRFVSHSGSVRTSHLNLLRPATNSSFPEYQGYLSNCQARSWAHCTSSSSSCRSRARRAVTIRMVTAAVSDPGTAAAAAAGPASWIRPYSPGPLTEAEFEQYWQQGYVVKQGLLTQQEVDPCLEAIERCVARTPCPLHHHLTLTSINPHCHWQVCGM